MKEGMGTEPRSEGYHGHPLATIWRRPRATIRGRLRATGGPEALEFGLAALAGISTAVNMAAALALGRTLSLAGLLVSIVPIGALLGVGAMHLDGALLASIGRPFGGEASARQLRLVFAWANVPRILDLSLWVILIRALGGDLFSVRLRSTTLTHLGAPGVALAVLGAGLLLWIYTLWVMGLCEAHRFSTGSALVTLLLARLIVGALALILVLAIPVALYWGGRF